MAFEHLNWRPLYNQLISIKHFKECDEFWIRRYSMFICWCRSKNHQYDSKLHERHHIIPRSWNGSNDPDNLVVLTFREHIIAHYIIQHTNDSSMLKAFRCMYNTSDKYNFRISTVAYDEVRRSIRENAIYSNSIPVICLDTNEIFDSISEAERNHKGNIKLAIERHLKADGMDWRYYDKKTNTIIENKPDKSYLHPVTPEQQLEKNEKISKSIKGKYTGANSNHGRKVIRLDTLEIFDTARIASLKYSNNKYAVASAINGNYKFNGTRWQYYDDYLNGKVLPEQKKSSRFNGHKHSDETKRKISRSLKKS